MTISSQFNGYQDILFCCCLAMALPRFRLSSSLLKPIIKSPLLCCTASISTQSSSFLNPCTNPNANFVPLIKTSLSCSVAEAEVAPAAVENEQEPKNRLIAQNIPWDAKEDDMKALFGKHGTVVHVEVLVICQFLDFEKFCC
jgi:hypothetical protein